MIVKSLKHVTFTYDDNNRTLLITPVPIDYGVKQYALSRTETFSLSRFMIRIFQKGNKKKK